MSLGEARNNRFCILNLEDNGHLMRSQLHCPKNWVCKNFLRHAVWFLEITVANQESFLCWKFYAHWCLHTVFLTATDNH